MTARRSLAELLGDPSDEIEQRHEIVKRLNKRHAFIAGKGVIREDGAGGFAIESVRQFHDWYANDGVWTKTPGGADKFTSAAAIWMQSEQRRQFDSVVFDPRDESPGCYNLWRGFTYTASSKGSCDRFLDHLFDNVCRGDKANYRWLVGWMAHLIQRPWEKPGTAVVLKGPQGAGKSSVGEHLGALLSRHYATVSTPRGLLGQFNAHLSSALLVQLEESFFAGDKAAEGDLKHKITGATINLERKGVDVIELRSFHRYLITSNERWTVPARHDERRYAIFDVGTDHAKDGKYFGAIAREMEAGGYRALMRHLLDFDLSRVDVRAIPQTEALAVEKITGLKGVHAWWHEMLTEGALPVDMWSRFDKEPKDWRGDGVNVRTDDLRSAYEGWMRGRRHHGDLLTGDMFGRELRDMCPSASRVRRRADKSERAYFYDLPTLDACRLEFARWLDSEVEWA